MRKALAGLIVWFMVCVGFLGLFVITPVDQIVVRGATINVPGDNATITEAINYATSGDTILVAAGTYNENIVINKDLTITGADKATTIINGANTADVVAITTSGVSISGFSIKSSKNL